MNEIKLITDLTLVGDEELCMNYILCSKAIPTLQDNIISEMLKRNIERKLCVIEGKCISVEKQPPERVVDTKINNIKKIILHCIQNNIDVWSNLTIKQRWLDKQKFYDHSFFEDGTSIMNQKPYKVKDEMVK